MHCQALFVACSERCRNYGIVFVFTRKLITLLNMFTEIGLQFFLELPFFEDLSKL